MCSRSVMVICKLKAHILACVRGARGKVRLYSVYSIKRNLEEVNIEDQWSCKVPLCAGCSAPWQWQSLPMNQKQQRGSGRAQSADQWWREQPTSKLGPGGAKPHRSSTVMPCGMGGEWQLRTALGNPCQHDTEGKTTFIGFVDNLRQSSIQINSKRSKKVENVMLNIILIQCPTCPW